ncbi:Menaquinone via futalosine polyprenyltransferase (MenA homolog) [Mucinivorans hirudinis]|uniref:Menaquinone via futalosine polyprenyltransferase (MenA homolog) n=1 Tax=Mucinivorans hirudinis TaxID=1433126 RepID=A0A060R672_9BACT|nr:Menaquinone via futalosine polyprenyltransferase (MenA homolog) [Mucinivorans hirudinis]
MKRYLSLIKFSHTIFAMPFALIGYAMGVRDGGFSWQILVGVIACMVLARSAAMAFNRVVDRRFDAANPRTATREIPAGKISVAAARLFVVICSVGFIAVAATFNTLTLILSPVALAVILGYSYMKRFTSLCHLVLGLGLAIAPSAAYIAATGTLTLLSILYSFVVLTWVAGFDIIFALQDVEFDSSAGLFSIPSKIGIGNGLIVSGALHFLTLCSAIAAAGLMIDQYQANRPLLWSGVVAFGILLLYQHLIVKPTDLSRVNLAFGTTNGIASIVYATLVIASIWFA